MLRLSNLRKTASLYRSLNIDQIGPYYVLALCLFFGLNFRLKNLDKIRVGPGPDSQGHGLFMLRSKVVKPVQVIGRSQVVFAQGIELAPQLLEVVPDRAEVRQLHLGLRQPRFQSRLGFLHRV